MRTTDITRAIKPFVLRWIGEMGGGTGPYAPSPHDLSSAHHTGSLADSQAPQFLKTDGSRQLTGNLAVADGVTIDGIDISAHAASASAHHDAVTLDANADTVLSLSTQEIGLDAQGANEVFAGPTSGGDAVPTFRALVVADLPSHTHDDRYYTETEVDTLLTGYSVTGHTHDDRYYTETEVDALLAGYSVTGHTHDDRYYTETEVDTLLAGYSVTGHTHDDRYYTETEVDTLLAGKSDTGHTHAHGDLTGVSADQHHSRYTDSEAVSAVDGATITHINFTNNEEGAYTTSGDVYFDASVGLYVVASNVGGGGSHAIWNSGNVTAGTGITITEDSEQKPTIALADHASRHIDGGADTIDGDKLEISYSPTGYTPDTSISEADSSDDLAAHLAGIENEIASPTNKPRVITFVAGEVAHGGTSYQNAGGDFYYNTTNYPSGSATWRVTLKASSGKTAYAELCNVSDGTQVAELTTTSTGYYNLSTSVTLTTGKFYRVRIKSSGAADYTWCLGSYIEW